MKIKGLHDYCTVCNKVVTSKTAKCGKKKVLARNCEFREKHKKQSRIWNPLTKKQDKIRTWQTKDPKEVISLHIDFKNSVINQEPEKPKVKPKPTSLGECMVLYFFWLEDKDLPIQEHKKLSQDYIKSRVSFLKRFSKVAGNTTDIALVNSGHVGLFYNSLKKYAPKTFNNHIQALRSFFDWLIKYGYEIENPFKDVKFKYIVKDPKMILEEDLIEMLKFVTYENGFITVEDKKRGTTYQRNLFKPWLKAAFGLFLLTGERRDGVFHLKWEHQDNNYLKIPNHKNNLRYKIEEYRDVYITPDLAELLLSIGGSEGYILCPERENRKQVATEASRAFTHFWKVSGNTDVRQLKHLRKTYATRMRIILGDLAQVLKLNKDDTQFDYYIDKRKAQEQLEGKRVFDIDFR